MSNEIGIFIKKLKKDNIKIWLDADKICFRAPMGKMDDNKKEEIKEKKTELIKYLREIEKIKDYKIIDEINKKKAIIEVNPTTVSSTTLHNIKTIILNNLELFYKDNIEKINSEDFLEWVNLSNKVALLVIL